MSTYGVNRSGLVQSIDFELVIQVAEDYLAKLTTRFAKYEGSSPNIIIVLTHYPDGCIRTTYKKPPGGSRIIGSGEL